MPVPPRPAAERFWEKVSPEPNTGCLLWLGATFRDTHYGAFRGEDGRTRNAHRVAWELVNGPVPEGMCVLHHCDNRVCVFADPDPRRSHLFLGTVLDNTRDMDAKGRRVNAPLSGDASPSRQHPERLARGERHGSRTHPERLARGNRNGSRRHPERVPRGERHPYARLTEAKVRELRERRARGETLASIAADLGVGIDVVHLAATRKTWKHVA